MKHILHKVRADASERNDGRNVSHFTRHVREVRYLAVCESNVRITADPGRPEKAFAF